MHGLRSGGAANGRIPDRLCPGPRQHLVESGNEGNRAMAAPAKRSSTRSRSRPEVSPGLGGTHSPGSGMEVGSGEIS